MAYPRVTLSAALKFLEKSGTTEAKLKCPGCKAQITYSLDEPIEKLYWFAQRHTGCTEQKKNQAS